MYMVEDWKLRTWLFLIPRTHMHTCTPSRHQLLLLLLSRSVMSDSLRPHGLQHTRLPCPSPTPGVYSNSHPLSLRCHPTISPSVVPFSSHLQSFPASGSFQMSWFFASGDQSIGVSASASVLPMNIQKGFLYDGLGVYWKDSCRS